MNGRTSKLLRRVAKAHAMRDPNPTMSEARKLAHLKAAWQQSPRPRRGAVRVELTQIHETLIKGPSRG